MIKTTVIDLLDSFIPITIRSNRNLSREELVRTRAMLAILGFSIIVPVILIVIFIALQIFTGNDFSRNVYILMVIETVLISQHIYFQSYGNLRITAGAYALQFLLVIVGFTLVSGGLSSPLITLLLASPMVAYMTMGQRAGVLHIIAVLLTVIGLLLQHTLGLHLPNMTYKANYPYTAAIACGVALSILAMFLLIFEDLLRHRK